MNGLFDENLVPRGLGECAFCPSGLLVEKTVREVVAVSDAESFSVEVPVVTCRSCEYSYTDDRAEKLRHEAYLRHRGLLTPSEIKQIRQNLSMSRPDFESAYGIPTASMERWENGRLAQNRSTDTLLRALMIPAIARRLDRRKADIPQPLRDNVVFGRFPSLDRHASVNEAQLRARDFHLREAV